MTIRLHPGTGGVPATLWRLRITAADGWLLLNQLQSGTGPATWISYLAPGHEIQVQGASPPPSDSTCPTVPPGRVALPEATAHPPSDLCAGADLQDPTFLGDPGSGTVWAEAGGHRFDVVWQPGFTATIGMSVDIFDPLGRRVVRDGHPVGDVGACGSDDGRVAIGAIGGSLYW